VLIQKGLKKSRRSQGVCRQVLGIQARFTGGTATGRRYRPDPARFWFGCMLLLFSAGCAIPFVRLQKKKSIGLGLGYWLVGHITKAGVWGSYGMNRGREILCILKSNES